MDTYTHLMAGIQKSAMDKFEEALNGGLEPIGVEFDAND